jgi:hypothetical protein
MICGDCEDMGHDRCVCGFAAEHRAARRREIEDDYDRALKRSGGNFCHCGAPTSSPQSWQCDIHETDERVWYAERGRGPLMQLSPAPRRGLLGRLLGW